jgi:hypothetical protein
MTNQFNGHLLLYILSFMEAKIAILHGKMVNIALHQIEDRSAMVVCLIKQVTQHL